MNNTVIYYGRSENLLNVSIPPAEELRSETWTGNCYNIIYHAYITDYNPVSDDVIDQLRKRFENLGGLKQHYADLDFYSYVTENWATKQIKLIGNLTQSMGLDITIREKFNDEYEDGSVDHLAILNAAYKVFTYDTADPHNNVFLINADHKSVLDVPHFYSIGSQQLITYNRSQHTRETYGGNDHEVNPINGSPIVYMSDGVICMQHHPLQQLLNLQTYKQLLTNIYFVKSTLDDNFRNKNLIRSLIQHLDMEIVDLDTWTSPPEADLFKI